MPSPFDGQYETFQHYGTNAARLAFVPNPSTATGVQPIYIWYATDTGLTWLYDTSWHSISGPSGSLPATVQGDMLYASAANTIAALAKDANATRYLSNTGATNNPAWAQVNLANGVTGDLPFANLTQGSALSVLGVTGNATADNASIAAGSDHQVMRRSGTSVAFGQVNLAQSAAVTGVLPVANGGTGSATGAAIIRGTPVTLNNAAIIAMPSGTTTLVTNPGAGFRIKLLTLTYHLVIVGGGTYTGLDASYASLWVGHAVTNYQATDIADDVSLSLGRLTSLLGNAGNSMIDIAVPYFVTITGASSGATGYIQPGIFPATSTCEDQPLVIGLDNNGSGNLGGGNAGNSLKVSFTYMIEAV